MVGPLVLVLALAGRPGPDEEPGRPDARIVTEAGPDDPNRTEVGLLPAIAYDSDIGLGLGVLAAIAKFEEGAVPYAWRLQILLFAALRDRGAGLEVPYHNDYVQFDVPRFVDPRLRLTGEVAFRKFSNAGWYGFGSNAERVPIPDDPTEAEVRFHTYDRIYPSLQANLRWQLVDRPVPVGKWRLELFGGTRVTYNDFSVYEGSLLERDIARSRSGRPEDQTLADLLVGTDDHLLWVLNLGLLFDTRDQEFVPSRGTFTELSIRASPGVDEGLAFAGATLASSWFAPLWARVLVVAARGVVDVQGGTVPFYEQSAFGAFAPSSGPGGGTSVRGVPLQRFAGKLKAIGNLELRARLLPFIILGQRINLGLNVFADLGRVWADLEGRSLGGEPLDEPFSAFALGLGGGIRAQWGETFVIRADFAQSPTEGTTGLYIDVGHIF